RGRAVALVFAHDEAMVAGVAPPVGPALGGELAIALGQVVVVAEVFAGQPAEVVDRALADRVFAMVEAFDQPLDAVLALRGFPPLARFLLARAEVLGGERDQRLARVLAVAIAALDDRDQIGNGLDVAELEESGRRSEHDLGVARVKGAARADERVAELAERI